MVECWKEWEEWGVFQMDKDRQHWKSEVAGERGWADSSADGRA